MIDGLFHLKSAAALKLAILLSAQPEALSWSDRELAERIHAPEASVRRGRAELREAGLIREVWIGEIQLDPADPDIEVEIGPDRPDQPDRGALHLVELSPDIEVEIGRDPSDLADPDIEVEIGPDQPDRTDRTDRGQLHQVELSPDIEVEIGRDPSDLADPDIEVEIGPDQPDQPDRGALHLVELAPELDGEDDPPHACDHACDHTRDWPDARTITRDWPRPEQEEQEPVSWPGIGQTRARVREAPDGGATATATAKREGGQEIKRAAAPRSPDWSPGRVKAARRELLARWEHLVRVEICRGAAPGWSTVSVGLEEAGLPPEAALSGLALLVWRTRPRTTQLRTERSGAGLLVSLLRAEVAAGGRLLRTFGAEPPTLHELAAIWRGQSPAGLLEARGLDLGGEAEDGAIQAADVRDLVPDLAPTRGEAAGAAGEDWSEARALLARVRAALGLSGMSLAVALEGAIQAGDVARVRVASETARELLALKGAA